MLYDLYIRNSKAAFIPVPNPVVSIGHVNPLDISNSLNLNAVSREEVSE